MPWPKCDSSLENKVLTEKPIWHTWTFHHIGLWISAIFGLVAIIISFILIYLHASHYLKPWEQKHIIRILLMVPIYAAVSFLSYYNYTHSVYFEVVRDCYEAFAIASFFSLLCHYIAPDLHKQKNYFRGTTPRPWIWPMKWIQSCCGGKNGAFRTPRSGLTWFNVIWSGVFQYCFIRVFMTCVAVATQAFNRYCLESLNPAFSHVWVMGIEAIAVTIAMYCIIQFYLQLRIDIAQHKPLLKVLAIKLVIFLSFWQTLLISLLTSTGAIKDTEKIETPDIKVGIPSMLLCIEMSIFSVFHLWAFSYRPYVLGSKEMMGDVPYGLESSPRLTYQGGFMGMKAIIDALNPWDMIKAVARAGKWLFRDRKNRENDSSYGVSRVPTNMDAFPNGPPVGQKLTTFDTSSTTYAGAGGISPKPQYPNGGGGEEHLTLLPNAQGFGASRHDTSPYRSDTLDTLDFDRQAAGDISTARYAAGGPGRQESGLVAPRSEWSDAESGLTPPSTRFSGSGRPEIHTGLTGEDVPYFDPPPTADQKRGRKR